MEKNPPAVTSPEEDAIDQYLFRTRKSNRAHTTPPKATIPLEDTLPSRESARKKGAKKSKLNIKQMSFKQIVKYLLTTLVKCFCKISDFIFDSILIGIGVAILLNIINKFLWPELPEKLPVIYEFFNGFFIIAEFVWKTALSGIASAFNGTFLQFCNEITIEMGEMWNAFLNWMSAIHF